VLLGERTGQQAGGLSVPDGIVVTPALHSGTLFVASGKTLRAFDLCALLDRTSAQHAGPVWSFEPDATRIIQPVLVDDRAVFVIAGKSQRSALFALSQRDGAPLWSQPLEIETDLTTPPLLVGTNVVVITVDGKVSVVEAATGNVRHTFPLHRRVDLQATPCVVDNRIVLSDFDGHVLELVLTPSGPLINPLFNHRSRVSSIAANARYIALGHMSGVTLLSSRGLLLWTSDTIESVSTTPVVASDSVFVLDDAGNGLLFDVLKSNPVSRMKLQSGDVGPSPLVTQSRIVTVSAEGIVVAIRWH
jgi:outer membrane protein assembly factor BamB